MWVDGGWGVDALVGAVTRRHRDVDLIVSVTDAEIAHEVLVAAGLSRIRGNPPTAYIAEADDGRRVDYGRLSSHPTVTRSTARHRETAPTQRQTSAALASSTGEPFGA